MILVDASVWVDHLRVTESTLVDALARDDVACHPLVIVESMDVVCGLLVDERVVRT